MTRKTQSIKGEIVDFDLFEIKAQIASSPKTPDVLMRESYIDIKRRRASRKDMAQLLAEQEKNRARVRKALDEKSDDANTEQVVDTSVEDVKSEPSPKATKEPQKRKVRKPVKQS